MMKTNSDFFSLEEQDDFFQSLTLKELKELNKKNEFQFQNKGDIVPEIEVESPDLKAIDEYIQKLHVPFNSLFLNFSNQDID